MYSRLVSILFLSSVMLNAAAQAPVKAAAKPVSYSATPVSGSATAPHFTKPVAKEIHKKKRKSVPITTVAKTAKPATGQSPK